MTYQFSDPAVKSGLNTATALLLNVKPDEEENLIQFSYSDLQQLLTQEEEATPSAGNFLHIDNWTPSPSPGEVCLYCDDLSTADRTAGEIYIILPAEAVSDLMDYFKAQPMPKAKDTHSTAA